MLSFDVFKFDCLGRRTVVPALIRMEDARLGPGRGRPFADFETRRVDRPPPFARPPGGAAAGGSGLKVGQFQHHSPSPSVPVRALGAEGFGDCSKGSARSESTLSARHLAGRLRIQYGGLSRSFAVDRAERPSLASSRRYFPFGTGLRHFCADSAIGLQPRSSNSGPGNIFCCAKESVPSRIAVVLLSRRL